MDFDAMYAAITGRDERFDGTFYTAVLTTGIYCRPSCPAAKPKARNVRFYSSAAAAQQAGFRACRRCVPEALPGSPAWKAAGTVAGRALRLIDEGVVDDEGVPGLARRLGYSTRNLTRLLVAETGASAVGHARARRARLAHGLITTTPMPFADVAFASGFSSIRQFNDTIREVYAQSPTALRSARTNVAGSQPGQLRAELRYRAPFDMADVLTWFAAGAVRGIEEVHGGRYTRSLALRHGPAVVSVQDDPAGSRLLATLRLTDLRDYGHACAMLRRILDLDADPAGIDGELADLPWLGPLVRRYPGKRIPGCATPQEALVRAIVGHQVRPAAARRHLDRLVAVCGPRLESPVGRVDRLFPTAGEVASHVDDWFTGPKRRRQTVTIAMDAANSMEGADRGADEVTACLHDVPGIGTRTVAYTLLRGYQHPDVDLTADGALLDSAHALGLANTPAHLAEMLKTARPWRSYAALHLWAHGRGTTRHPSGPASTRADHTVAPVGSGVCAN